MSRLDHALVNRGLCESREKAKRAIIAGLVRVNRQRAQKPSDPVQPEDQITLEAPEKYVSRGGHKIEHALHHFDLNVTGIMAVDLGASTGGFTDCLLQRGAARVHAVDVGAGQIDWKLRNDPRVSLHERLNARFLRYQDIGEPIDLVVCDVSFISVTLILPAAAPLLQPEGEMVILIKPQFEVGREQVGRGGIVRDPELHRAACERVENAVRQMSYRTEIIESPILGAEGNKEFLLYARH